MTRKNSLVSLALLSIGLFWAACTKSDPPLTPAQQTQNEFLGNAGMWKVDSLRQLITAKIGGTRDSTFIDQAYAKMDTLIFQPIEEGTELKAGHGGYRRGLLIQQHTIGATPTSGAILVSDTMNWQIASGATASAQPRLVIFYDPGANEQQFSFEFLEKSSSKMVLRANRTMSVEGQPGNGYIKYTLVR